MPNLDKKLVNPETLCRLIFSKKFVNLDDEFQNKKEYGDKHIIIIQIKNKLIPKEIMNDFPTFTYDYFDKYNFIMDKNGDTHSYLKFCEYLVKSNLLEISSIDTQPKPKKGLGRSGSPYNQDVLYLKFNDSLKKVEPLLLDTDMLYGAVKGILAKCKPKELKYEQFNKLLLIKCIKETKTDLIE